MNPTDLRTELADRAGESDAHHSPDLLPGVRERIRSTRRKRTTASASATAVLVASAIVAVGVVPGLTRNQTAQPATSPVPPADFTAEGLTFKGDLGDGSILQEAFVGNRGETSGGFDWTPTSIGLKVAVACKAEPLDPPDKLTVRIQVGDIALPVQPCQTHLPPTVSDIVQSDSGLWATVHAGRSTRVRVELVDPVTKKNISDPTAVVGVGFYTIAPAEREQDPMPTRTVPTVPEDYVQDGLRFRHQIGSDTLLQAKLGKAGENVVTVEFTPTSRHVRIALFCQGEDRLQISAQLNGKNNGNGHVCGLEYLDNGLPGQITDPTTWPVKVGEPNRITLRLLDDSLMPVDGSARIGIGIYQLGPQRMVGLDTNKVALPETTEYAGNLYRLAEVRTADATTSRDVSISTPDGVPFLVGYGTTNTGPGKLVVGLGGVGKGPMLVGGNGAGQAIQGFPARATRQTATAAIDQASSDPTKGILYIAVYLPAQ